MHNYRSIFNLLGATRNQRLLVLGIVLLALGLRTVWLAQTITDREAVMEGDGADYHQFAMNLGKGFGFSFGVPSNESSSENGQLKPTARRPPLYPYFAAGLQLLSSAIYGESNRDSYALVLIVQVLLDTATVFIVFCLVQAFVDWRAGIIGAMGYALNFYVYQFSGMFLSETLFIFLLSASLLVLFLAISSGSFSYKKMMVGGFLFGLATLTRPLILFFPFLIGALFLVWEKSDRKKSFFAILLFILTFMATLLPWSIRNRLALGDWVLVSTVGGQTFYHSNHATSNGQWVPLPIPDEAKLLSEPDRDKYYYRKGLHFILENPGVTFRNTCLKILRLYYVFYPEYDIFFGMTLLLAAPGFVYSWKRNRRNILFLLFILYTTLICAVFWGTPRFRAPLLPSFLVYAGSYVSMKIWTSERRLLRNPHFVYLMVAFIVNLMIWIFSETVREGLQAILSSQ